MMCRVGIALGLMLLAVSVLAAPASASITVRGGHATISVSCAAGSARACSGVVSLRRTISGHVRSLGKKRYSAAPGGSVTLRIKLNKIGRRLLHKHHAVGAQLRWTTEGSSPSKKGVRLLRR
jgi:hypothetical protein